MKKQLLKLTLLAVVFFSATIVQGQALYTTSGSYKISTSGLDTNLYMTIDGATGALVWAEELPDNNAAQVWYIAVHRTPASPGLVEITSKAGGIDWTMTTSGVEADHPTYTLTVEKRLPKEVEVGDWSGKDQFQRRKTKVNADGLADSTGSNPSDGNNALFLQTPWGTNSRYGIIPSAAGDPVQFDGGGIDVIQYHLIEAAVASVNTFGLDAFSVYTSNNQLTVKGATSKVKQISIYSVLGNKVLSKTVSNSNGDINLNVTSLSTGLYILKMVGVNGEKFSKKIIKE
ncbi:T9SS type A sorting domain-containing protein [Polaribacter sp. L3A8]|uniref:T9SS type A sorting domain-containing protein n=1 Tax=Polaribacter sp. L3A8 TaxID=2686361 RepID=UPI00131D0DA5|nr:T9SS type A sorting domain-containing protein [Polaribacter sp. L3A8]